MSTEQNIAAVRRFWEGFNAHNLNVWDEVCTTDFINHDPGLPTPDADLPTIKQTIGGLLAAFPDMTSSEDDLIAAEDKVVVRRTLRGTHKGEFMGVAASGNEVEFSGVWLAHLRAGKLKEPWVYLDTRGVLRLLGAIPAPALAGS